MSVARSSVSQDRDQVKDVVQALFRGAHQSVMMSTGLTSDLLEDVADDVKKCIQTVVSFSVCFDWNVDVDAARGRYPWLFDANEPKVHLSQAKHPIPHWILVDGKNFRLEKPHPQPQPAGSAARAWQPRENMMIIDAESYLAKTVLAEFEAFTANSKIIKP